MQMNNDPEWLKRKVKEMDEAGIDDSACSVGGLAIECGATFDEKGIMTLGKGHPADLVIDIPRLKLKSGDRVRIASVKKPGELFEVTAWSEELEEQVSVIVFRGWLIPVLPREAAEAE